MRRCAALVAVLVLPGCELLLDPDGGSNEFAPRIDRSFPEAGQLELTADSLLFSAEGEDDDSLDLSWTWTLDDEVQAAGTETQGTFDTDWELPWQASLVGETVMVRFEVSDGEITADLFWSVSVQ